MIFCDAAYEILVADPSAVTWRRVDRGEPCEPDDFKPVEGGRDAEGNFLFVAKAPFGGGGVYSASSCLCRLISRLRPWPTAVHPAEVTEGHRDAEIPYGGRVNHVDDFEILAYHCKCSLHDVVSRLRSPSVVVMPGATEGQATTTLNALGCGPKASILRCRLLPSAGIGHAYLSLLPFLLPIE